MFLFVGFGTSAGKWAALRHSASTVIANTTVSRADYKRCSSGTTMGSAVVESRSRGRTLEGVGKTHRARRAASFEGLLESLSRQHF